MKIKRLLFLGMAICLTSGVKAQIQSSDVLFYVREDARLTNPQTDVVVLRFINGKRWRVCNENTKLKKVHDNLKSNSSYYENKPKSWGEHNEMFEYNSEMSNAKWCVYSWYCPYIEGFTAFNGFYSPPVEAHTVYEAYKRDFSLYVKWEEPGERVTYKRISKDEIKKLTFTGARDFLQ